MTCLGCVGIVRDDFTANLAVNLSVKDFFKLSTFWRSYGRDCGGSFLTHSIVNVAQLI